MNRDEKPDTSPTPESARPDSAQDAPQPDPGPAKKHGDPLTDIDDEIASGGGGND